MDERTRIGLNYRVATLPTLYLTVSGIIITEHAKHLELLSSPAIKKDRKFCAAGLIIGIVADYFPFKIISIISPQKIIPLICRHVGIHKYVDFLH